MLCKSNESLIMAFLLCFFRGEIASKPANPLVDSYKSQTSFRDKLQEYQDLRELNRTGSTSPEKLRSGSKSSLPPNRTVINDELGQEMTEL